MFYLREENLEPTEEEIKEILDLKDRDERIRKNKLKGGEENDDGNRDFNLDVGIVYKPKKQAVVFKKLKFSEGNFRIDIVEEDLMKSGLITQTEQKESFKDLSIAMSKNLAYCAANENTIFLKRFEEKDEI